MFDRSRLFIDAVETILRSKITIAATATTTAEAVEQIERHDPDVLIAGIETVGEPEHVIALVREAVTRRPELKVIVLSSGSDSQVLADAFGAGAAAFIAQNGSPEDVAVAIRQASDPSIHFASQEVPRPPSRARVEPDPALTEREIETLRLVAQGLSNADIGQRLKVTEQTVKFHLSNVFRKLEVSNRTQASRRAWAMNLV